MKGTVLEISFYIIALKFLYFVKQQEKGSEPLLYISCIYTNNIEYA